MSIFQKTEKTQEEKLKEYVNFISDQNIIFLNNTKESYERVLKMVWESEEFTPQEIFDYYGEQAYLLFQESDKVWDFIKTYEPDYIPQVNIKHFTINQNGTVTVNN
jgi:hypothetical protein